MTGQKKKHSIMETCLSTFIGFFVALGTWRVVAWAMDIPTNHGQSFLITAIFTAVSIVRGYCVRRLFNLLHTKEILK